MSASSGRYAPAEKRFGDWAFRTIHHGATRESVAEQAKIIRTRHGNREARDYLDYLLWLGTYPVIGSARWLRRPQSTLED